MLCLRVQINISTPYSRSVVKLISVLNYHFPVNQRFTRALITCRETEGEKVDTSLHTKHLNKIYFLRQTFQTEPRERMRRTLKFRNSSAFHIDKYNLAFTSLTNCYKPSCFLYHQPPTLSIISLFYKGLFTTWMTFSEE